MYLETSVGVLNPTDGQVNDVNADQYDSAFWCTSSFVLFFFELSLADLLNPSANVERTATSRKLGIRKNTKTGQS